MYKRQVDIGAEYGDVRPLDEARIRTLNVNRARLVELIDSRGAFITELACPVIGCITWPQREFLVNVLQPRHCNEKLLEFLTRRSVADFQKFVRVLAKEQAHLVPLLLTDGGDCCLASLIFLANLTLTMLLRCTPL